MKPMEIGVFLASLGIHDPLKAVEKTAELGMKIVQMPMMEAKWYEKEGVARLRETLAQNGVTCTGACAGFVDERYDDIETVTRTVGLTNPKTAPGRVEWTKRVADFAKAIGEPVVTAHVGVVPLDRKSEQYRHLVRATQEVADYCASIGGTFALETGQETAEHQLAFLEDCSRDNLKVNFDCGNMILYGSGKPIEAVEVLRDYIVHTHVKDGRWPTEPGKLGEEAPLGEGEVGIDGYVAKLKDIGYRGPLVIEREAGADRIGDIKRAKELLERLVGGGEDRGQVTGNRGQETGGR